MAKAKRKPTNFRNAMASNIKSRERKKKNFGYLNLPDNIQTLKLEENTRRIRLDFVPYIVTSDNHPDKDVDTGIATQGTEWWKFPFKVHSQVGVDNERVVCPTTIGQKCPICEHRIKLIKQGAHKDTFKVFYPQERTLYVVIPIGDKKLEEVPHVWDMSDRLCWDAIVEAISLEEDAAGFPSLEGGLTAEGRVKWKAISDKVSYPELTIVGFTEREDYDASLLDEIPSLDNMLEILSYKAIEAKFLELDEEEDGGDLDDEDDEPVKAKITPVRRGRPPKPVVEEEEEEEEEEDDDAPPTAPIRKRKAITTPARRGRPPKPVVDEEEEDDEEEEEEEVKPTIKRGRKPAPKIVEEEEEDEEDDEPVVPSVKRGRKPAPKAKSTKGTCPYGHRFGSDHDKTDDCDTCELWNECLDASEELE